MKMICVSVTRIQNISLCISLKHSSHEITELSGDIEFKLQLEPILNHITKQKLNTSLSSLYQNRKDGVTTRGKMWHTVVDQTVKKLHKELDDMKKENKAELLKQRRDIEEMIGKIEEIIRKATKLNDQIIQWKWEHSGL